MYSWNIELCICIVRGFIEELWCFSRQAKRHVKSVSSTSVQYCLRVARAMSVRWNRVCTKRKRHGARVLRAGMGMNKSIYSNVSPTVRPALQLG
jgi:hypothetical protein